MEIDVVVRIEVDVVVTVCAPKLWSARTSAKATINNAPNLILLVVFLYILIT